MEIVIVTGGFDPLHSGHIEYFKAAKALGQYLIVGVNSDEWLMRKKGKPFMNLQERVKIIEMLEVVNEVITFNDNDNTAIDAINKVKSYWGNDHKIIFANGGDRTKHNIPEMLSHSDVNYVFGVGGEDKKNSSSWILQEWKAPKTNRTWGYYRVLHESGKEVKVKELTVEPGQKLSMQRHKDRSEHWFVDQGTATVYTLNVSTDFELYGKFTKHQSLHIPVGMWHQLANETTESLKLIEIQYGENCIEEDIERL
jgi:cytidyltransferase-like protein